MGRLTLLFVTLFLLASGYGLGLKKDEETTEELNCFQCKDKNECKAQTKVKPCGVGWKAELRKIMPEGNDKIKTVIDNAEEEAASCLKVWNGDEEMVFGSCFPKFTKEQIEDFYKDDTNKDLKTVLEEHLSKDDAIKFADKMAPVTTKEDFRVDLCKDKKECEDKKVPVPDAKDSGAKAKFSSSVLVLLATALAITSAKML